MPLAFRSQSHGTIAFGFFNIESHMLLLEELFFFADEFCAATLELAASARAGAAEASVAGFRVRRGRVGNLHGAIAGEDLSGLIGSTYRLYPFPEHPSGFKQSPTGDRTRGVIEELAREHGEPVDVRMRWTPEAGTVAVGDYLFDGRGFDALLEYVEMGGYPRWRDDARPAYVADMTGRLASAPPPWRARA